MKKNRKNSRKTIAKITQERIKIIEQEYWERYNSGIPQWQQIFINMRESAIKRILGLTNSYTRKELESIQDTLELVALSYDVQEILKNK